MKRYIGHKGISLGSILYEFFNAEHLVDLDDDKNHNLQQLQINMLISSSYLSPAINAKLRQLHQEVQTLEEEIDELLLLRIQENK